MVLRRLVLCLMVILLRHALPYCNMVSFGSFLPHFVCSNHFDPEQPYLFFFTSFTNTARQSEMDGL